MTAPRNLEEYLARSHKNSRVEGHGLGNVWMHMPCPFCAAPDFLKYELQDMHAQIQKEHVCVECKRGMKAIVSIETDGHSIRFFQTVGADLEEWMLRMPRLT